MKKTEIKIPHPMFWAGLFVLVLSGFIHPSRCQAFDASINIAPNIINFTSNDHAFGIHTDVPYSIVENDKVLLICPDETEMPPLFCYADSRGYLVARFNITDLKNSCELSVGDYNILVLKGETRIEPIESFSGEGEVLIIESEAELLNGSGPKGILNQNRSSR